MADAQAALLAVLPKSIGIVNGRCINTDLPAGVTLQTIRASERLGIIHLRREVGTSYWTATAA